MISQLAVITAFLVAATALVVPSPRSEGRLARRASRQSRPMVRTGSATNSDPSYVQDDANWAGAAWNKSSGTFTTVTGTFNAPAPSGSSGAAAAAWVGIDGFSCQTGLFQTGIEFTVTDSGPTYQAWYEWYPDPAHYITSLTISAGDQIKATITASSATSGTAVLENLTTGQSVTQSANSTHSLCGQNAEWIVEDFEESGSGLVPFANFSTVVFTSASASGPSGAIYTPSGATILDIKQNGTVLTSASASGDAVIISYV